MKTSTLLLSLAAFASAASLRVTDALLPRFAADFGIGLARASWAITAFAVTYGLMQVLLGPLGDRYGKLRVIACAGAAAAVGNVACFLAPGFDALIAARALAGGACACIIPLAMAWIGDVVPYTERQPVIARFLIGQILGIASGSAVGGFAAQSPTWRWPFAALAIWFAVAAALIAFAARRDPAPRSGSSHFFQDVAGVVALPWARVIVVTVFIEGVIVFGALAFIPTHLHFTAGMELAHAGLMLVAFALGGIVFALFVRHGVRHLGERGLSRAGAALLGAALLLVAWAPGPLLAATGCLAAGLGFYMLHNTLQTNATQMEPRRRGAAMALFATLYFIGQSVGVALAGVAAQAFGTRPVIAAAAILVLPVGFTFASLLLKRPRIGAV